MLENKEGTKRTIGYNKLQYVEYAEYWIKDITKNPYINFKGKKVEVTTNQIRNILSLISPIYDDIMLVNSDTVSDDIVSRLVYAKMKIAYAAGRNEEVKDFVSRTKLLEHMTRIGNNKSNLILFCHYVESLVAYHRYYGGKEK